jgi:hypothetical protein
VAFKFSHLLLPPFHRLLDFPLLEYNATPYHRIKLDELQLLRRLGHVLSRRVKEASTSGGVELYGDAFGLALCHFQNPGGMHSFSFCSLRFQIEGSNRRRVRNENDDCCRGVDTDSVIVLLAE